MGTVVTDSDKETDMSETSEARRRIEGQLLGRKQPPADRWYVSFVGANEDTHFAYRVVDTHRSETGIGCTTKLQATSLADILNAREAG